MTLTTSRQFLIATITLLALIHPQLSKAQVDAQFTQYYEVPNYYNPAAIGNIDYLRLRAGSRLQWVGIDNAPTTLAITADMPFKFLNKRFAAGLIMQQESMGLYSNMNLGAQLGYKLKLLGGQLGIGLQIGFIDEGFKGSEVYLPDGDDFHQGSDEAIPTTDLHGTAFDVSAGVFYIHKYFWAGISGSHLTQPTITLNPEGTEGGNQDSAYEFQAGRTVYFMAGSNIPIKNTLFEIRPSLMVKSDFTFTTGELTGRMRYNKFLTFGLGYRYEDAVSVILGAEYKGFYIGYNYDYPISDISKATSGSHEIWVGYQMRLDLGEKNRHKHKSIRIM